MSHYSTYETEFIFDRELIETLEEIYGKGTVEVHKEPVGLYGYRGDLREQKAHIIVRRKHINPSSNDLGFIKENGKYKMVVSEYDDGRHVKRSEIVEKYVDRVIQNRAPRGKYRVKHREKGQITLQVLR